MTANRPQDFGDQFPSDLGDTPPGSPVDGYQERDYRIRRRTVRGSRPRPEVQATPNLNVERPRPEPRVSFMGVIVKRVHGNRYIVLRQDGKRGFGFTRGDDDVYDVLLPGETVSMHADQTPGVWTIEGSERRKEMGSIRVTNSSALITTADRLIPLDVLINQTGTDENGVNLKMQQFNGGIRVLQNFSGQYEISVAVNVQYTDPQKDQGNQTRFRAACIGDPDGTPADLSPNIVTFDRNVGFTIGWDQGNCEAQVSMKISESDYMLYSPDGGGRAVWTNNPKIAGCLEVGTRASIGWLKLVGGEGGGFTWLGNGEGNLKIRFPGSVGEVDSHLIVEAKTGEAVKLAFSKPGGTGKICFYCYYCGTSEWEVDKGLVISGPCIEAPSSQGSVSVDDTPRTDWQCQGDSN